MKPMNRRQALGAVAGGSTTMLLAGTTGAFGQPAPRRTGMGIVTYALGLHQRHGWEGRHPGLSPALAFFEECRRFGAGGIQFPFGTQDAPHTRELRRRAEQHSMHVEAILSPPRDGADVTRFENDVRVAREAGATVARTVILPGRRYEQFKSLAEFREFEQRGLEMLQRAEPVLARHQFRLAVENHKDQRITEKLATLKRVSSEWIGLCVDMGNNFPLLDDPLESVRAFAPWAMTVHIKDQAVRDYAEGFLYADVALGEGFLDLPALVKALRDTKPDIKFNFETITRDALKVPILSDGYWATLADTPARNLARTLAVLKTKPHPEPFVDVSKLPVAGQVALERRNVERSIAFAREKLGL